MVVAGVGLCMLVLTGVENTWVDGCSTFWAAGASLAAYLVVVAVSRARAEDAATAPLAVPAVRDLAVAR
jgi:hypothetical protein